MIVSDMFPDDNLEIAWQQHDVYGRALGLIIDACNRYTSFACSILSHSGYDGWSNSRPVDHRTLQDAHDIIAGAWRWYAIRPHFNFGNASEKTNKEAWLGWLGAELKKWYECPHLVRLVQIILANQNTPIGYAAEDELGTSLLRRYDYVRWSKSRQEMQEAWHEKKLAHLIEETAQNTGKTIPEILVGDGNAEASND